MCHGSGVGLAETKKVHAVSNLKNSRLGQHESRYAEAIIDLAALSPHQSLQN